MTDVIETKVSEIMTAFEAFKDTNETRLKEIEKRGAADTVTETKLAKIEADLVRHEDANQKATLAQKAAEKAEAEVKEFRETLDRIEAKFKRPGAGRDVDAKEQKDAEYKAAFGAYLRKTEHGLTDAERKTLVETKTLQAGVDTLGGYYLAPPDLAADIIKNVVLMSPVRSIARVTSIGVQSLKLPKRTGTFAARRVGELGQRSETTGYTTGMQEIFAPELFAEVHISEQMIEDQFFNIEAEMMQEFSEQFAVKEGSEFVVGAGGSLEAEGFLTNAGVASINSGAAAAVTADGLINVFYNGLKTAYAKNATWVMNRQTLGSVRKLKDTQNQYLWQPGIAGNVPNTILGATYVELPDMPNEAAGSTPIAVGDFNKGYRIVDRVLLSVLRDPYTIANTGQILYRARKRVGGQVVQSEALAKLKCSV